MSTPKKSPKNTTAKVFDLTIPVHDYLTAWEMEQVELLTAERPTSATRHDLQVLAVFAKSRLGQDLDLDELMTLPVRGDELALAVEALVDPFFATQLERVRRRYARAARITNLTPEERAKRIKELKVELQLLESEPVKPN